MEHHENRWSGLIFLESVFPLGAPSSLSSVLSKTIRFLSLVRFGLSTAGPTFNRVTSVFFFTARSKPKVFFVHVPSLPMRTIYVS